MKKTLKNKQAIILKIIYLFTSLCLLSLLRSSPYIIIVVYNHYCNFLLVPGIEVLPHKKPFMFS